MTEAQRRGQPMMIGLVALFILILTLIFSFPYLLSEDWIVGLLIWAVGVVIVAVILYLGGRRELELHRNYGQGWLFDRKNMVLGFLVLTAGIMMIVLGGPLSSVVIISAYIVVLGIAFVFAGISWIILGLRG
jgi:hypothetical protein